MGKIRELLEKLRMKSQREKEAMEDIHLQKKVLERQKNANEREYERYVEEARQKAIANRLAKIRKQKSRELMTSNNFTGNKYLFKDRCYLGRYY